MNSVNYVAALLPETLSALAAATANNQDDQMIVKSNEHRTGK